MRRLLLVVTVAAVTGASAALGASPQSLILQKSDVPAGAKKQPLRLGKNGSFTIPKVGHVRVAAVLYIAGTKYIGTAAGIFGSSSAATRAFSRFRTPPGSYANVHVSGLGDQQRALGYFKSSVSSVVVLVRKGPVVWETAYSTLGKSRRSAVVAGALSYAHKQKERVG